ncbi:MAG TPA: metalloregulator ArsR/SmtB family transcription factor [Hyphomicrobiaceae bacterium]|nr:metalloregulator ArsR/SmtB family transcription factor [Hyphomicrobiaceae bacterium]
MVYLTNAHLDRAFAALADPTRRAIIERLAGERELAVTAIAAPFAVSLPAVMKHLDVLARANLIERCKSGRTVHCRLKAEPMRSAVEWLTRYERFWNEKLDRLANFLEEEPWPTSQASRSSDASERRRAKSSAPGRTRKK